ncbi:MAG TPA: Gfo/Idh/MocA family oxidoreductase, partial [Pirellula sp.]|nr:Gfo/Idh/MocA family oxidoreductase [Pirellula sp.]
MNTSTSTHRDLALIGSGYWGKNLARNFHALGSLHTLCDVNAATLSAFQEGYQGVAKSSSIEQVLRDPSIRKVAIATPAAYHFQIAKNALMAGKDLYVEKPLCLNVDEANELVQLADSNARILMVGHLLQYHPCIV